MNIELVTPTKEHRTLLVAYKTAFAESGEFMAGGGQLGELEFDDWLKRAIDGVASPHWGRVPATQYLALDQVTGELVGMIQLRHILNDSLLETGGHIGYSVHPSLRRKGYATEMMRLCCEKARELGIDRVLVVCDEDNLASAGVIEKCGGVYEDTRIDPKDGSPTRRYWIALDSL